jgi:hypothetical protein
MDVSPAGVDLTEAVDSPLEFDSLPPPLFVDVLHGCKVKVSRPPSSPSQL